MNSSVGIESSERIQTSAIRYTPIGIQYGPYQGLCDRSATEDATTY